MTLDASGRLGIGTTNPTRRLEVSSDGTNWISGTFAGTGNTDKVVIGNLATPTIGGHNAALNAWSDFTIAGVNILFSPYGATAMRLDASGNLGLGVTPSAWETSTAFQLGNQYAFTKYGITRNAVYNAGYKYIANGFANSFEMNGGAYEWYTAPSGTATNNITFTKTMTLDASGNLGLGVTPSPWSVYKSFDIETASLSAAGVQVEMVSNAYFNGSNWIYKSSTFPTRYVQNSGAAGGHSWFTAPSGTAGNAISFTQAMTLDASGNLGIGITNPTGKLHSYIGDITAGNAPASSGTTPVNAMLNLTNNRGVGMYFGGSYSGTYAQWIQVADVGNLGVYYPLALNPNGGNVGIGTTNPQRALHVLSGVGTAQIQSTGTTSMLYFGDANSTGIDNRGIGSAGNDLWFMGGGLERMRITSGGNVLIGTTSNSGVDKVRVNNDGTTSYSTVNITNANSTATMYVGVGGSAVANTPLQNNAYVWNGGASALVLGTSNTERMIITSGGNVGIGTTNPNAPLSLSGSADVGMRIKAGASALSYIDFDEADSGTPNGSIAYNHGTNAMTFATGGSNGEKMRITSGGNVGIGTTSPSATLMTNSANVAVSTGDGNINIFTNDSQGIDIGGKLTFGGVYTGSLQTGWAGISGRKENGTDGNFAGYLQFYTRANGGSNTERMRITSGGEVYIGNNPADQGAYNLQVNGTGVWGAGAYVDGSDSAVKKNIQPLGASLDIIKQMNPVTFEYQPFYSKDTTTQTGFIAQELQQVLSNKVYKNGIVKEGGQYLGVAYQHLIPLLVKSIQELEAQVQALKSQLNNQ
jgi:hypothetical protein